MFVTGGAVWSRVSSFQCRVSAISTQARKLSLSMPTDCFQAVREQGAGPAEQSWKRTSEADSPRPQGPA